MAMYMSQTIAKGMRWAGSIADSDSFIKVKPKHKENRNRTTKHNNDEKRPWTEITNNRCAN